MKASLENPIYTVYLVVKDTKYNLTPAITEIQMSNQDKQVANCVTLGVVNFRASTGKTLCDIIEPRQRVFIYANDGKKKDEVFRGWTWTKIHDSDLESSVLTIKCYDNLIYLQESEDSLYFSKGKNTKSVISEICKKWGISLNYSYSTITHDKLVLRGTLTDILMSDILEKVKKKTGKRYVIISQKDVMYISGVGTNTTVYEISKKNNATKIRFEKTMDGMVTQVKILGSASKDSDKVPVVATIKGDTAKYGTLQKLQNKDKDTSLADAKKEANTTISEHGKPEQKYEIEAADIPWILKGDKVYVHAGHVTKKNLIAIGIERNISNSKKTMTLTCIDEK